MIGVLEVGGTHVTAATVADSTVLHVQHAHLDADADADTLLAELVGAGRSLGTPAPRVWSIAMPDPFDYPGGVAWFSGVGKFESLYGVDVGRALRDGLPAERVVFLNDADAFALGEARYGVGAGRRRVVGLTLGTGIGSGWIVDGTVVGEGPGVPPDGRAHRLTFAGRPLEDAVSRRAIRAAYRLATGTDLDVAAIADLARRGDATAADVLRAAMHALGSTLGPPLREFDADVVALGGSIAKSWDLLELWFAEAAGPVPPILPAALGPNAALLGAAAYA
jgi:glucokinase